MVKRVKPSMLGADVAKMLKKQTQWEGNLMNDERSSKNDRTFGGILCV